MKLEVKHEVPHEKSYGFLRCSEESVPKFKALAPRLGYPSMVAFLDALAEARLKDLEFLKK